MQKSSSQNTFLQQILQALQGGGGVQLPQAPQQQQQPQQPMGVDPNQLFQTLISGAIQNTMGGKKIDYSKYNVPRDFATGPLMHESQHQIESQATAQAVQNGADPNLLDRARQFLGKNAYVGLCEAFVERMTQGAEGIYRSAIDAWNQHGGSRQEGLAGVQPGDAVYFAPDASNQGFGHTGVYMGNGNFISATDNGIRQYNLKDWQNMTGQKVLGYVPQGQKVQQTRSQLYPTPQAQPKPMTLQPMSQAKSPASKPPTPPLQRPNPMPQLSFMPKQQPTQPRIPGLIGGLG